MMDWQPIETAPKDGAEIIVWSKDQLAPYLAAWDDANGWMVPDTCPHGWTELLIQPTHWTTMPEPPK